MPAVLAFLAFVVIALLRGTLLEKSPSRLIVDVSGVGYDVLVPLSTFYGLGDPGDSVTLRTHTHVREDVIALYGFLTRLEQDLFERLIAINGVGPKLALAVLSGIEPAELIRAVRTQDVARLTAIPGVGKKTAERIGLELKDRLPASMQAAAGPAPAAPASAGDQLRDDLLSALVNLGYHRPVAEKAVEQVLRARPDVRFEDALKDVLRVLMRA
jgi:Holliday junction DNA helicase RuvA